jgi:hypothetical protein
METITPQQIFALHPSIRWAGLATSKGQVIFSKMRPGVKSLTPEEDDRVLLELRAQYITEICNQTTRWAGPTEYVAMSHEKFIELITVLEEQYVVAVTVEKDVDLNTAADIAKIIQKLR